MSPEISRREPRPVLEGRGSGRGQSHGMARQAIREGRLDAVAAILANTIRPTEPTCTAALTTVGASAASQHLPARGVVGS